MRGSRSSEASLGWFRLGYAPENAADQGDPERTPGRTQGHDDAGAVRFELCGAAAAPAEAARRA